MNAIFTIAGLTVREAVRRRFVFAAVLVSLAFIGLAFIPIHPHSRFFFQPDEINTLIAQIMATFGGEIAEFFAFLFAIALTAGSISGEIERGVLSVIAPKPVARWSIYCGKWLGINLFVVPCLSCWIAILQFAIAHHVAHTLPGLWRALPVMALYPLVFSAVTLFFSSFTSTLLAIILPLMMASIAWSEGLLRVLGYTFDVDTLKVASKVVVYVAPLNPLSRWVEKMIQPTLWLQIEQFRGRPGGFDPPANSIDLAWIIGYGLAFLIAGLVIFQRRDL